MKIIAFNVNSIKSILNKTDLVELINNEKPDIFCLGETKTSGLFDNIKEIMETTLKEKYYQYWNTSEIKKGYSGTCIFCKKKPKNIIYGLYDIDNEGRVITCEYAKFYLVHVYTPNSGENLKRLNYRINTWDIKFRQYIIELQKTKPVILCGDLNVAHKEIDLKNPKTNLRTAGFTIEERDSFDKLLNETNLIDSFRLLHPEETKYSYWSYRLHCRLKNPPYGIGWRIDYFLIDNKIKNKIISSNILTDIQGSDHAPVILEIDLK